MADEKEKDVVVTKQTLQEMELELKQLEISAKKAELEDLKERLAERQMKRENKEQRSKTNGATLKQNKQINDSAQKRCNHRKGGNGAEGVVGGKGDDPQYCVMKHMFCNQDIWVRCLRCGKTWKPPVESTYTVNGKVDTEAFNKSLNEYQVAVEYNTRNAMSKSIQYSFSDGGKYFREVTANSDLR